MALAYYEAGSVTAGGSSTVVIPITSDVPRSSPTSGTVIFIFYQMMGGTGDSVTDAVDDTTAQDSYSTCIFEDGLNHYRSDIFPAMGLLVNDLAAGVNNITLTLNGTPNTGHFSAIAITGIQIGGAGPLDPTLPGIVGLLQPAEQPVGGGGSTSTGGGWNYNPFGAVSFTAPLGAADTDWDFFSGALAFFWVSAGNNADLAGWTWDDATIVPFVDWSLSDSGQFIIFFMGVVDPMTPGTAMPTVTGSPGAGYPWQSGGGLAIALAPGVGPTCETPPPAGGTPVFDHRVRLLGTTIGDFAPDASPCFNARIRLSQ